MIRRMLMQKVIINVANGQTVNLIPATMEIGLESLDSRVDTIIVANQRPVETFECHFFS